MMRKLCFRGFAWLLAMLSLSSYSQTDEDGWKLAKFKDGIEVYTRAVEGSKIKEYKTNAIIDAEPEELVKVLFDVDNYVNWMAHIKKAELLDLLSDTVFVSYSEVKVPWPFDNRDNITKSVIIYDELRGSYAIDISLLPDYLSEKKGIIRMREGGGIWRFTPAEDGKTIAYHQFMGDPGGSIPAWIVNMFLVDGPYKTMLGLIAEVEEK